MTGKCLVGAGEHKENRRHIGMSVGSKAGVGDLFLILSLGSTCLIYRLKSAASLSCLIQEDYSPSLDNNANHSQPTTVAILDYSISFHAIFSSSASISANLSPF